MKNPIKNVSIKEYGFLVKGGQDSDLSCSSITESAFNWLLVNGQSVGNSRNGLNGAEERGRDLIRVKKVANRVALQVINFVGVIETPCGTRIEILPKIISGDFDHDQSRNVLLKMLAAVENLKLEQFHKANLKTIRQPFFEVLIFQFLTKTAKLIKRGLRSSYQRIERESSFLKGQLKTARQIRQRPGRQHFFHVEYDIYTADRAENRLLHSALFQILKWTKSSNNQRLVRELLFVFEDIQKSNDYKSDFRRWSNDRTLAHYRDIKPWCELILNEQSPVSMNGESAGISFLFPMEVLFERYVAKKLKSKLVSPFRLMEQIQSQTLVTHKGQGLFKLKPDIVIYNDSKITCVMDTKWKLINQNLNSSKDKYNLSQSDMYQLFSYGEKYLKGEGDLYLIYPQNEMFDEPLSKFQFTSDLNLYVVPYNLVTDVIGIDINALL